MMSDIPTPVLDEGQADPAGAQGLHNLVTGLTRSSPLPRHSQLPPGESVGQASIPSRPLNSPPGNPAHSTLSSGTYATSSMSPNTADVVMSGGMSNASTRQSSDILAESVPAAQQISPSSTRSRRQRVQKDVDDPSSPLCRSSTHDRYGSTTPATLARMLGSTAISQPSLEPSLHRPLNLTYTQASSTPTPLAEHLLSRGFLDGRHSDIVIHAFGNSFPLHRLILDRAPFFSSALSSPWTESTAKEITLEPEKIDSNITASAFVLALRRLYGSVVPEDEYKEAAGLFATACWLEMSDLVEASVESLLRQLTTRNTSKIIRLVSKSYYGKPGERLLASAKALLYREGWQMPIDFWDDIPGEIVSEIVGGDGFFVEGEWERWILAKKLYDRSLKAKAQQMGLLDSYQKQHRNPIAVSPNKPLMSSALSGNPKVEDEMLEKIYFHPDIQPLSRLLDESIHYVHLTFEQLQYIRKQKDCLGSTILPDNIIADALWAAMELRQKVMSAEDHEMELGLCQTLRDERSSQVHDMQRKSSSQSDGGEWININSKEPEDIDKDSGDHHEPQRWWVPSVDSTSVVGEVPDSTVPTSYRTSSAHPTQYDSAWHPAEPSTTTDTDPVSKPKSDSQSRSPSSEPIAPLSYTIYPPFRFSAEFPNPRLLKERKRVYSRTVWYAGSMWKIYIQKVRSAKSTQLGVYLHRARDRDSDIGSGDVNMSTVDERIGLLEREMLMRRREQRTRRRRQYEAQLQASDDSGSSGHEMCPTTLYSDPTTASSRTVVYGGFQGQGSTKRSSHDSTLLLSTMAASGRGCTLDEGSDDNDETLVGPFARPPTLPQYTDSRPTIKTYFKIYSPSRGGRLLSVYESAPDTFNYSQSWVCNASLQLYELS